VRDPLDRRVRVTKREAANTGHRPRGEDEGKMVHQLCPCGHASGASYGSTLAARFQRCDPGIGRLGIVKSERIDLAIRYPSRREIDRRGHAAGGTTAHVLSPPHWGKTDRPLKLGKAAHRKKPQPGTVRVSPDKLLHLSLERTSQRHVRHYPTLLHLPKAECLSGLCRFRCAHSCRAAMVSHHLPCSQRLSCEATWFSSTSKLFLYPIVISIDFQEMFREASMPLCPLAQVLTVAGHQHRNFSRRLGKMEQRPVPFVL
jgi:hypothetical protein